MDVLRHIKKPKPPTDRPKRKVGKPKIRKPVGAPSSGAPALAAIRRVGVSEQDTAKQFRKSPPLTIFTYLSTLSIETISAELSLYRHYLLTKKAPTQDDAQTLLVLTKLINSTPARLVKSFINEYVAQLQPVSLIGAYRAFMSSRTAQHDLHVMRTLIRDRITVRPSHLPHHRRYGETMQILIDRARTKYATGTSRQLIAIERQYIRPKAVRPVKKVALVRPSEGINRPLAYPFTKETLERGKRELISTCKPIHKHAIDRWLREIDAAPDTFLRYVSVRNSDPFASSEPAFTDASGETWYHVKKDWYIRACSLDRPYVPDAVTYVLSDGQRIVETQELYTKLLAYVREEQEKTGQAVVRKRPLSEITVTDKILDVAVETLKRNETLASLSEPYFNEIVNSLRTDSVAALADDVTNILSSLTPVFESQHIHVERLKRELYPAHLIRRFPKELTFPELYSTTIVYFPLNEDTIDRIEAILSSQRRLIHAAFIEDVYFTAALQETGFPRARTQNLRVAGKNLPRFKTHVVDIPAGQMLGIHVSELDDGELTWTEEFIDIPARISGSGGGAVAPPAQRESGSKEAVVVEAMKEILERDIAPGLFKRLKAKIETILTVNCATCQAPLPGHVAPYRSIYKDLNVAFCASKCFAEFKFKTK